MKKRVPPAVRPSLGSLSLPRRTRAFLAPRPFSAVAATAAAIFRSHPPFTALPAGNCSLRKGPPPLFPSSLQTRNYISQKPAEQTRENYYSQESPRRRARSLVALLLGAESGRAELGSPLHVPAPSPNSAL